MLKPVQLMDSTLPLDQLRERFPRTAELFRSSRSWLPNKEHDIAHELVQFLDKEEFEIVRVWVFDRDTDERIGFEPAVKIKGQNVDIDGRWFKDLEQARLHGLDHVVDIFEEEQKIIA